LDLINPWDLRFKSHLLFWNKKTSRRCYE
jgi:hypothetical protein